MVLPRCLAGAVAQKEVLLVVHPVWGADSTFLCPSQHDRTSSPLRALCTSSSKHESTRTSLCQSATTAIQIEQVMRT